MATETRRSTFLVFGEPLIGEEEIREVVDTLRTGWLGTGPKVQRFEADFARYTQAPHALAVNSCTAALHLVLDALGIGAGDEVITTPLTFCATANVILHTGAVPVFVDVDPTSGLIDPEQVQGAISPRTKAILPVHLYGQVAPMDALLAIARRHHLAVVEDAAHCIEGSYRGTKVGSIGDATCFSFYATKNLVTGEGGMVTTANDDLAEKVRIRRLHGLSRDAWKRYSSSGFSPYEVLYPGYKANMTDLMASLGIHQLARIEANWQVRDRLWRFYDHAFHDLSDVANCPPAPSAEERHARHLYTLQLKLERLNLTRDQFLVALQAENIGSGVHFRAVHLHRYYRERFGYRNGSFPHAERIAERTISLPLTPKLSLGDAGDVVGAVRRILKQARA